MPVNSSSQKPSHDVGDADGDGGDGDGGDGDGGEADGGGGDGVKHCKQDVQSGHTA